MFDFNRKGVEHMSILRKIFSSKTRSVYSNGIAINSKSIEKDEPNPKSQIRPNGMPSGKIAKQLTISPVGITFDCIKGNFNRQDIISALKEGDVIKIEKYKYKNKDAYMLVGGKYDKDFGVLGADIASEISKNFQDNKIEGYIKKRDFFYSEKEDDYIETCKVKIYILRK